MGLHRDITDPRLAATVRTVRGVDPDGNLAEALRMARHVPPDVTIDQRHPLDMESLCARQSIALANARLALRDAEARRQDSENRAVGDRAGALVTESHLRRELDEMTARAKALADRIYDIEVRGEPAVRVAREPRTPWAALIVIAGVVALAVMVALAVLGLPVP